MKKSLPGFVKKYFWGDDLKDLNWVDHQDYITKTILEIGDSDAVAWLLSQVDRRALKKKLSKYKLSPKSDNFWRLYL